MTHGPAAPITIPTSETHAIQYAGDVPQRIFRGASAYVRRGGASMPGSGAENWSVQFAPSQ